VVRVRFAPSPTGSLHLGGALTAVANRRFADERGGVLVLRIDDTDTAREVAGSEGEILRELAWLGISWDEGPVRQSERAERHREAGRAIGTPDEEGALRFQRTTLLRADGRPTYHLASVVDDLDLGITHVIRGKDLLPSTPLHEAIARALGAEPPEYLHHGLLVGNDGRKLSKREQAASLAGLRELGIPPEAVRAYLEELDLPRGDVRFDETRLRRLAVEALGALSDEELAFYDALETNDSAVKILGDETLRAIARELVETVKNNVTIDWTLRENVRAQLRVLVKRILRKYGYPPDKQEKATQIVLEQAALLCAEWTN